MIKIIEVEEGIVASVTVSELLNAEAEPDIINHFIFNFNLYTMRKCKQFVFVQDPIDQPNRFPWRSQRR
jgi:hypothetical protein